MLDVVIRYCHFLALFGLAAALIIENMAIAETISQEDMRNLLRVDAVYGLCAMLTLLFGLTLWLWLGKPSAFYSENPLFRLKLGLFILVALFSVYPTIFFIRHRHSEAESIRVPIAVRVLLKTELLMLPLIAVLAYLMARGIGLSA